MVILHVDDSSNAACENIHKIQVILYFKNVKFNKRMSKNIDKKTTNSLCHINFQWNQNPSECMISKNIVCGILNFYTLFVTMEIDLKKKGEKFWQSFRTRAFKMKLKKTNASRMGKIAHHYIYKFLIYCMKFIKISQKALAFCCTGDGNWKLKAFKLIFENPFW